ncbi:MAG: SDR family NAD(P)-dependent oxidoreductase [Clostridium sp.]
MKKVVLITGASSGIGEAFANIFAKNNYDLLLVSRNYNKLKNLQNSLSEKYKIVTYIKPVDLSVKEEVFNLYNYIKKENLQIDILINNAGLGYSGLFTDVDLEKNLQVIDVNITGLTILTNLIVKDMKIRNSGKILNVASTGAYQPGPYIATYYASKSYVLSFSYALREELKNFDINISILCPGATKTDFCKRAGKKDLNVAMSPEKVAQIGFNGLVKGKTNIIPGTMNKLLVLFSKILPNSINGYITGKIQGKVYKKHNEGH